MVLNKIQKEEYNNQLNLNLQVIKLGTFNFQLLKISLGKANLRVFNNQLHLNLQVIKLGTCNFQLLKISLGKTNQRVLRTTKMSNLWSAWPYCHEVLVSMGYFL